jgi:hypothetical protein
VLFALHTRPSASLKLIYSAGFSLDSRIIEAKATSYGTSTNDYNIKSETSTIYIPIGISLEHKMFSWFKTRFGVSKQLLYKSTADITDDGPRPHSYTAEQKSTDALTGVIVSLGIGLVPVNDFEIDLALTAGVYSFESMVSRASLKYHF